MSIEESKGKSLNSAADGLCSQYITYIVVDVYGRNVMVRFMYLFQESPLPLYIQYIPRMPLCMHSRCIYSTEAHFDKQRGADYVLYMYVHVPTAWRCG